MNTADEDGIKLVTSHEICCHTGLQKWVFTYTTVQKSYYHDARFHHSTCLPV